MQKEWLIVVFHLLAFKYSILILFISQFATAGDDNTVKIWDLRKQKAIYTIPASNSVVPDVRYDQTGEFLATCSFDHSVRGIIVEYAFTYSMVNTKL